MAHKWYAIQTYSGSELSVKKAMLKLADEMSDDRIAEVLVPTEDLIEVKKGKKTIIERPVDPAYAFAKIDLDTALWHRIKKKKKNEATLNCSRRKCYSRNSNIEEESEFN